MQRDGIWYFERLIELTAGDISYRRYNAAGALQLQAPGTFLLRVVTPPPGNPSFTGSGPYWLYERQLLSRHPAVAAVEVEAEPGEVRNYLPDADFPKAVFSANPADGRLLYWDNGPADGSGVRTRREPNPKGDPLPAGLRILKFPFTTLPPLSAPAVRIPLALVGTPFIEGGAPSLAFQLTLSFTVRLATTTFNSEDHAGTAAFYVSLLVDGVPVEVPYQVGEDTYSRSLIPVFEAKSTSEATFTVTFLVNHILLRQTAQAVLRFHASAYDDVIVTEPVLSVGTATNGAYVNTSRGQTNAGPRLSKRDTGLTLQLADTYNTAERTVAVLQRSVLLADTGGPVGLWREGTDPATPAYYLIDLLVRDRLHWQQKPCWVLRGVLKGEYSPAALLVDPAFSPDVAFQTTSARWDMAANTWELTAVQNLAILPPRPARTTGLLSEADSRLLLSENGAYYLIPENAY